MTKTIKQLRPGDVVTRFPYAGPEQLPVTVSAVLHARLRSARIVEGTDASGRRVLVPVGHFTNVCEVR